MSSKQCFHLAFPVNDLQKAKTFYVGGLGCTLGRESEHAIILNMHGNQIVAHRVDDVAAAPDKIYPRHFGIIFSDFDSWDDLLTRAQKNNLSFYREPSVRFATRLTEHNSFFLVDPSNNLLEFKFYKNIDAIFGAVSEAGVGEL